VMKMSLNSCNWEWKKFFEAGGIRILSRIVLWLRQHKDDTIPCGSVSATLADKNPAVATVNYTVNILLSLTIFAAVIHITIYLVNTQSPA
jgi:hypothetical protein